MEVPIRVPPGRNGIAPNLVLKYNSYHRNGWVGVGWTLDMGSIQRSTKYGLNYSANDFVASVNGTLSDLTSRLDWGLFNYGAKIESAFSKFLYPNIVLGWTMTTKEGTNYYYGGTDFARVKNGSNVFSWHLDKVEDTNGNYMTVLYQKDQGEIYPYRIDYTGASGQSPTNYVLFYLESRPDPEERFTTGASVVRGKRLKTIDIFASGARVSVYRFEYTVSPRTGRSLLTKIRRYGKNASVDGSGNVSGQELPAIDVTYSGGTGTFLSTTISGPGWSNGSGWGEQKYYATIGFADINGDGLADVCGRAADGMHCYLSNGTSFPTHVTGPPLSNANGWGDPQYYGTIRYADVNGDGKCDICARSKDGILCWRSGGTFFETTPIVGPPWADRAGYGGIIHWDEPKHYSTIGFPDINGDGLADVCGRDNHGMACYTSTGNGFSILPVVGPELGDAEGWTDPANYATIRYPDVNGDGKADICARTDSGIRCWLSPLSGYSQTPIVGPPLSDGNGWQDENNYATIRYADVTGDGLTDICARGDTAGIICWSNHNGSFESGYDITGPAWTNGHGWGDEWHYRTIRFADLNGDGRADICGRNDDGMDCYLSEGDSFPTYVQGPRWSNENGWDQGKHYKTIQFADVNGDGKPGVCARAASGIICREITLDGLEAMDSITNGLGGTYAMDYTPSSAYPNILLPFVLQTVSSIAASDGRGVVSETLYEYADGKFSFPDREFQGFGYSAAHQMIDEQSSAAVTKTWYLQDYYRKGKIEEQLVTSLEGHTKRVENTWELVGCWGAAKFPRLAESVSTAADAGYTPYEQTTSYVYDGLGNVLEEHKEGMTPEEEISTYYTYTNFGSKWIVGRPTEVRVENGSGSIVSRKWMDYDPNTGNLLTEETCKSDTPATGCVNRSADYPRVSYQYYGNGNVQTVTDPRGYVTSLSYDTTNTFVREKVNALGHKTTTTYDPGTGNLLSLVPPHLQGAGYSFSYTYDVFGRRSREDRPDGGWTSYSYVNIGNGATQYVQRREHITGGPSALDHYTYTYLDGLGRTYKVDGTGPEGKTIRVETDYDSLGRLVKRSNPRFTTDARYDTQYTYDGLSRVVDVLTPDGYHVGTSYQGFKKVVTNARGYSTKYTYDVYGRLKQVEDANGTKAVYAYDTAGNLVTVVAAQGRTEQNTTTMTYDSLGNKRSMTDPDMGTWTYQYDKASNLVSQTDAKGQTITFEYDELNRLELKSYPDHYVTLSYDDGSVPYSKGKLTQMTDPSGQEDVLSYDRMQRATSVSKYVLGTEATFRKSFDTAGRVVSITYLSGTASEKTYSYEYDVAGNLLYVKDNATGAHLIDYSDFTALGQRKTANAPKTGNCAVKTTYTYDAVTGRVKTIKTQKTVSGTPSTTYQNVSYDAYDGSGNILTLRDILNGTTHTYSYDGLERLLTATGTGTSPYSQSYTYDRIGNLKTKSDVGTYSYTYSNKPHAVRSAGSLTNIQYDANGNMTRRPTTAGYAYNLTYDYDNKPTLIKKDSTNYVAFTYDGNGRRVKKQNYTTGKVTLYFGQLYEVRDGVGGCFTSTRAPSGLYPCTGRAASFTIPITWARLRS